MRLLHLLALLLHRCGCCGVRLLRGFLLLLLHLRYGRDCRAWLSRRWHMPANDMCCAAFVPGHLHYMIWMALSDRVLALDHAN